MTMDDEDDYWDSNSDEVQELAFSFMKARKKNATSPTK